MQSFVASMHCGAVVRHDLRVGLRARNAAPPGG
jgi:hypothetical protein